ncbi:hypothetical protein EUX98_g1267 [Antrodiella citrinella]|uniref:Uncharacterized protein n=1 Tax=Antrodiella citrinella TaxID=2447956 RepID=A0A4S4N1U9_9APHY|nr:hypothetical protein EUX98_g1267 [Antrodiella citrinella]
MGIIFSLLTRRSASNEVARMVTIPETFAAPHDGRVLDTSYAGPYQDGRTLARVILHNIGALDSGKGVDVVPNGTHVSQSFAVSELSDSITVRNEIPHEAIVLPGGAPLKAARRVTECASGPPDDACLLGSLSETGAEDTRMKENVTKNNVQEFKSKVVCVHIGAQPNNSPHVGTITVFTLAAALCASMKGELAALGVRDTSIELILDLVDTAPDNGEKIEREDGLKYQRSHRATGGHLGFLPDYEQLLAQLSDEFGVTYRIKYQSDLLKMPGIARVLRDILRDVNIASEIAPEKERLALRRACPVPGCGIADKHGIHNQTEFLEDATMLTFRCPDHGPHTVTLENSNEVEDLEMNTPLRNLVRTILYADDTRRSRADPPCDRERLHFKVTGFDYAGLYQEQLLWRQLVRIPDAAPPVIVYAPLIIDWAGSKLSKSLYVKDGAYKYMETLNMTRFLSYKKAQESGTDWTPLFKDVKDWLEDPKKLFGAKSVDYIRLLIDGMLPRPDSENTSAYADDAFVVHHDGEVHDPLGAGSYVFERKFAAALLRYLGLYRTTSEKATLSLHLDIDSPYPPNVVNVILSILALVLSRDLMEKACEVNPRTELKPIIVLDVVGAPTPATDSLIASHVKIIRSVLQLLDEDVEVRVETFQDLSQLSSFPTVVRRILADEDRIVAELFPQDRRLGISSTCHKPDCRRVGKRTGYNPGTESTEAAVLFECSEHGSYSIDFDQANERRRLRFDRPLTDVIRMLVHAEDTVHSRNEAASDPNAMVRSHMRVTGVGAGFCNEQLLLRQAFLLASDEVKQSAFPVKFYAPLITDWSGARLSKSKAAVGEYEYLKKRGMDYLLAYDTMKERDLSLARLVEEVKKWVREPKKLFRPYSVEYIHRVMTGTAPLQN